MDRLSPLFFTYRVRNRNFGVLHGILCTFFLENQLFLYSSTNLMIVSEKYDLFDSK